MYHQILAGTHKKQTEEVNTFAAEFVLSWRPA